MATIGDLVVHIKANTSKFKEGIESSRVSMVAFAAAAIVALRGIYRAINDSIDSLSKLSDEANRLGSSVPALQKLQYAAEQSGVSTESMNLALRKLNVVLGQAQNGSEKANKAFASLGLSASDLATMSLDQKYIAIADAIKKLDDPNKQAAAAVAIFGKSGVQQLNLLKDNVSGLTQRFVDLGGVISTEGAGSVEKLGDKINDAKVVWQAFINNLTVALAGPLSQVIDWVIKFEKSLGNLKPVMDVLWDVTGISLLTAAFGTFGNLIDSLIIKVEQFLRLAIAAPKLVAGIGGGLKEAVGLGESTQAQKLFNLDESLRSDIERRKISIAKGPTASQPTARGSKVDVTVKAGKGLIVEVAESAEVRKRMTEIFTEQTAKEAAVSGVR